MPTEVKTGVGRIVAGHPSKLVQKRDQKTKALLFKPDGSPRMQTFMQVAFPRAEFEQIIWPAMLAEVSTKFPNGQVPPRFAWKYKDGTNGVDDQGKPYNTREGWNGCIVLTVTSNTGFSPPLYKWNAQSRVYDAQSVDQAKCGDYVVLGLSLQVNVPTDRTETPGLYVNPQVVEVVGYGSEILSAGGVDPMAVLGGQTYQLPPGASAVPVSSAPAGVGMPGMPAQQPAPVYQPQPGAMPGYAPAPQPGYAPAPAQPVYAPPPMQPAPVYQPQPGMMPAPLPAPAHDFVQPGYAPQPAQVYQPQPMPAPAGYPQQQPGGMPMPGMPGPR